MSSDESTNSSLKLPSPLSDDAGDVLYFHGKDDGGDIEITSKVCLPDQSYILHSENKENDSPQKTVCKRKERSPSPSDDESVYFEASDKTPQEATRYVHQKTFLPAERQLFKNMIEVNVMEETNDETLEDEVVRLSKVVYEFVTKPPFDLPTSTHVFYDTIRKLIKRTRKYRCQLLHGVTGKCSVHVCMLTLFYLYYDIIEHAEELFDAVTRLFANKKAFFEKKKPSKYRTRKMEQIERDENVLAYNYQLERLQYRPIQ